MNTAVTIADTISRTLIELAAIGAGLKVILTVAPQFRIAAPQQPKRENETGAVKSDPAAEDVKTGPVPLEKVS